MPRTKLAVVVLLLALISSCSSTQVHLFTEGSTEEELARLDEVLSQAGYQILRNSLPVPKGVVTPTIIYSPMHGNLSQIERLRDLLYTQGIELDLEPVSRGNHFYTGINVGLYPKAFNPGRKSELSVLGLELFGECPEVDATLVLNEDLTYTAEFIGWDDSKQVETKQDVKGHWWQSDQTVYLVLASKKLPFGLSRFQDRSDYALIEGIRLDNVEESDLINRCDFVYTELDPI